LVSNEFNIMPELSRLIDDYKTQKIFFSYQIEKTEVRQIINGNSVLDDVFDMKIFWIKRDIGLGFGLVANDALEKTEWYQIGSELEWSAFKTTFSSTFLADNT